MRLCLQRRFLFFSLFFWIPKIFSADLEVGSLLLIVPITQSATEQNIKISTIGQQIGLLVQDPGIAMTTKSKVMAQQILENYQAFMSAKTSCAQNAETAETLCIESKSPQAQIAKGIVDNAGPILAIISSAQKACSSTADMTTLAGEALALAKTACVGAKTVCDSSCFAAGKSLETLLSKSKLFVTTANQEIEILKATTWEISAAEIKVLEKAQTTVASFASAYPGTIGSENSSLPIGTTVSIVTRCQGYAKDVVLMTLNLANVFKANQSAKECAAKLATGNGGTSKAQYCEIPANAATSFCQCQKDNSAVGCPGSIAKTTGIDNPKDETGKNIKGAAGGNQFAGGFEPVKPQGVDIGKLNSETKPDSENSGGSNSKVEGTGGSSANSGGGPGSASGAHGASDTSKDGSGNSEDKKKWSFGSFMGLGGGGGSSSGKGGSGNVGTLGKKELDGIQRAIASEKLRAEISGAAGKSNWEKVNERYLRNSPTLLSGQ